MTTAVRSSALRTGLLLAAALALASLHLPGRPATVCLLRMATGIPCPACGGTTAAVRVGRGDLLGALRASPVVVLGALAFAVAPLVRLRELTRGQVWAVVLGGVLAAELWQLARFGVL